MRPLHVLASLSLAALAAAFARAHDTWVQTNTAVVRSGDAVYVSFFLGNHGNDHRDFKVAGKPNLDASRVFVILPDGSHYDLKPSLADRGYAPKEGFFEGKFEPVAPGVYLVCQSSDGVASYAPKRVVRSAKTCFFVARKLDDVPSDAPGFNRLAGDPFELVPLSSPIAPMGPGTPIRMRLLFHGQPLAGEKVSFIPMGETLAAGFDPRYERRTDASGEVSFEPAEANLFLIVAHHVVPRSGPHYTSIEYSATFTAWVPAVCPCCGE